MSNTGFESNVDPNEVGQFDALASEWWDESGPLRTLHHLNPVRADYIVQRTGGLSGLRVVDVGCGGGILTEALARAGANVLGIDLSQAALDAAKLHRYESQLDTHYEHIGAEALAERAPGAYDVVTCLELLEHVPDPASTIEACASLVKPGGHVFFSTISRTAKAYALAIVGAEYVARLLPRGTHDYERFIRPSELDSAGRNSGLRLEHLTGVHYNPLTQRASTVEDVDVNYMAHFRRDEL